MHSGGGPPDKWTKVSTDQTSDEALTQVNQAARSAPPTLISVPMRFTDGEFFFVANYESDNQS